ncbi:MAG: hypothetical protein CVT68_10515, partial [Actinobacteria bacterium HGW-Actinobacteria-8]
MCARQNDEFGLGSTGDEASKLRVQVRGVGSVLPWRPHFPDASLVKDEGIGTQVRNQVQLITYAERLGANLGDTIETVKTVFAGACGGVHLLPFFDPFDGVDAGFDPKDHTRVDPRLGSWNDVRTLATTHDVVVDVIVNHVSSQSKEFLDFRERGEASEFADMFLTFDSVFPHGATARDLAAIYRPRPGLPFTPMQIGGERRLVWMQARCHLTGSPTGWRTPTPHEPRHARRPRR